ncbi:MAG: hypothetical protein ACI4U2_00360, partial [Christensenellaceae bacterium]
SRLEVDKLIDAYNVVEQDIAVNYQALVKRESVSSTDGNIYYSSLSAPLVNVLRIEKTGAETVYRIYPDRIETEEGTLDLIYCYLPRTKQIEDESECMPNIPLAVIAYGVAAEYHMMNGLFSEATAYEKRYQDGLLAARAVSPKRRMRRRSWV